MGSSKKIDITRFDPTNASDDQIRLWLFAIIQAELEKDDAEIDEELIDECSDCEAFLSHSNPEITQEEYAIGLAKIKERAQAIQADGSNVTDQAKPKKRHFMRVAVYFLAATLAVAILSVSVVAAFNGSAAWEFIIENISWFSEALPGDKLDTGKVTLIKDGAISEYSSIEEGLKEGGFTGILYPVALPRDARIKQVVQTYNGNKNEYHISFLVTSKDITIGISNYEKVGMRNWDTVETLSINNKTFYVIYIKDSDIYQAGCYYNGFEHIVKCSNYDDLMTILNNMKELE